MATRFQKDNLPKSFFLVKFFFSQQICHRCFLFSVSDLVSAVDVFLSFLEAPNTKNCSVLVDSFSHFFLIQQISIDDGALDLAVKLLDLDGLGEVVLGRVVPRRHRPLVAGDQGAIMRRRRQVVRTVVAGPGFVRSVVSGAGGPVTSRCPRSLLHRRRPFVRLVVGGRVRPVVSRPHRLPRARTERVIVAGTVREVEAGKLGRVVPGRLDGSSLWARVMRARA